jgi:hypothetical protein
MDGEGERGGECGQRAAGGWEEAEEQEAEHRAHCGVEGDARGVVAGGAPSPEGGIDHQGEEICGPVIIEDIAGEDASGEDIGEICGVVDEIADKDLCAGVPDEIGGKRGGVEEPGESSDGER